MKNPVIDDRNAEEWDRIKGYVGAAKKAPQHPLQQEAERQQRRDPEHFADGGDVLDNVSRGTNLPGAPTGAVPPPPVPVAAGPVPAMPVPAMPGPGPVAPAQAPLDANLNGQASNIMGGITPDAIQRLMESLRQQNNRGQIGAGIAGIGDAIQSVGGIQGHNMENAEKAIQSNRDFALKGPEAMAALGKERYGLTKELGGDEPTSQRSFVAQQANLPLLQKLGFTPDQIKAMPASLIDGIRSGAISREDAIAKLKEEAAFKNVSLGLQKEQIEATKANQEAERQQAGQKMGQEQEKMEMDHPVQTIVKKLFGSHSSAPAITPDVTAYAEKHGITPEQALAIKQKREGQ